MIRAVSPALPAPQAAFAYNISSCPPPPLLKCDHYIRFPPPQTQTHSRLGRTRSAGETVSGSAAAAAKLVWLLPACLCEEIPRSWGVARSRPEETGSCVGLTRGTCPSASEESWGDCALAAPGGVAPSPLARRQQPRGVLSRLLGRRCRGPSSPSTDQALLRSSKARSLLSSGMEPSGYPAVARPHSHPPEPQWVKREGLERRAPHGSSG